MTTGLLNPTHIAILLIVVLVVLGPKKLPDTGRSLGRAMHEFKDAITGHDKTPTDTQTDNLPHVSAAAAPPPALPAPPPPPHPTPGTREDTAVIIPHAAPPASSEERTVPA